MALNYAAGVGAEVVASGSKGLAYVPDDDYSYTDSTVAFYLMMQGIADYLQVHNVKIRQVLAEGRHNKMTKQEVFEELKAKGITKDDIFNCFFPENGRPCCL